MVLSTKTPNLITGAKLAQGLRATCITTKDLSIWKSGKRSMCTAVRGVSVVQILPRLTVSSLMHAPQNAWQSHWRDHLLCLIHIARLVDHSRRYIVTGLSCFQALVVVRFAWQLSRNLGVSWTSIDPMCGRYLPWGLFFGNTCSTSFSEFWYMFYFGSQKIAWIHTRFSSNFGPRVN